MEYSIQEYIRMGVLKKSFPCMIHKRPGYSCVFCIRDHTGYATLGCEPFIMTKGWMEDHLFRYHGLGEFEIEVIKASVEK